MHSLSVVLPVYNEEGNIGEVIKDSFNFLESQRLFKDFEIIAVDDGSIDRTAQILKDLGVQIPKIRIVTHSKNLGYGKALMSGVKKALYPLVLLMDADAQFEISEINRVMPYVSEYDMIMGYRDNRKDSLFRVTLARMYGWLIFPLFGLKFKDINCGFKLLKKEVLINQNITTNGGTFYTEVLLKNNTKNFKIKEIPVSHFPRLNGKETGGHPRIIFNALIDLFKLKFFQIRANINKCSS